MQFHYVSMSIQYPLLGHSHTNSSLCRRMALAMKGAQLVKQANFAPAAIQHFNYSSEVRNVSCTNTQGNVSFVTPII